MSRTNVNFIVDAVALAAFLFLAASGGLIRYVLPAGSGQFKTLWGMDRHQWGNIHFWFAAALLGAIALHMLLHWRWIVATIQGRPGGRSRFRLAVAAVALAAIVGAAVSPYFGNIESIEATPPHRVQAGALPRTESHEITGSMTLKEVEQVTGVPAAVILKELALPSDLPTDEQLGRLRRQHGFEMEAVRKIVEKHVEQQRNQGTAP